MSSDPLRVYVIGNSGAGKSTLARRLAEERGVPLIALDGFAFVSGTPERRPLEDSVAAVRSELGDGPAVIEGCYADLVEALAGPEDRLIWLDVPVERCVEQARGRGWEPEKWPTAEAQDAFLPRLIAFIEGYPEDQGPTGRRAHEALAAGFPGSVERRG